ncbi:MAG: dockerin type I domain-containing protein [Candidatus Poribacteria bacterium]|nr:dockerin type I domain-containing protein [Candidatus Poribacteria bacterium]
MRVKIVLLFFLMLFLPFNIFASLNIEVKQSNQWPEGSTEDIKLMVETLASQFQKYLRLENKIKDITINIEYGGPRIEYRTWKPNTHYIFLSVSGEWWQEQLFYQFAHEFCHILHNHHEFGTGHPNKWFYESICMMASIWSLDYMSEKWLEISPNNKWNDWGQWIKIYSDTNKDRQAVQFKGTSSEWLDEFEQFLRGDANNVFTHHLLVSQLSYNFILPIFQKNPEAWNAVRYMPTSKSKIDDYMKEWYNNVDIQYQQFVFDIAEVMGISVEETVIASIDADVNNDGYVDLSDVLIVRSAIQNSVSYNTDINGDGKTDEVDVLLVKQKAMEAIVAAAPSLKRLKRITTWGQLKRSN